MTRAVARRGDPATSWAAAQSLGPAFLRASQRYVLGLLLDHGPMTDDQLVERSELSPSGTRTRRAELVAHGFVHDTGERRLTPARRHAIVWSASRFVDVAVALTLWNE